MIRKDKHKQEEDSLYTGLPRPSSESPFTVPGGYFESLPQRVMERIIAETGRRPGRLSGVPLIKLTAIAAGIALLAGISLLLVWSVQKERVAYTMNDTFTVDDIASTYALQGLDEYTLISMVAEQETMESLTEYSAAMDSLLFLYEIESYLLESNHIEYLIINSK